MCSKIPKSEGVNLFLAKPGELYRMKEQDAATVALERDWVDNPGLEGKVWITSKDVLMFLEVLPEDTSNNAVRKYQAKFLLREKIVYAGWVFKENLLCVEALEKIVLPVRDAS